MIWGGIQMKQRRGIVQKAVGIFMIFLLMVQLSGCGAQKEEQAVSLKKHGDVAFSYVTYFQNHLSERQAGSEREQKAFRYIKSEIQKMGYEDSAIEKQSFRMSSGESSQNLAVKKEGISKNVIVIGAHYDSVGTKGVDDNGSGVAALLECAKRAKQIETPYSFDFVFFGAEETGLEGSKHFVEQMSKADKENLLFVLNMDSILVGDKTYAYSGTVDAQGEISGTEYLPIIQELALENQIKLEENPGKDPEYPTPTTGDWSDHAPFAAVGIPYIYFEATNWDLPPFDGMAETKVLGKIMHTSSDDLAVIEKVFPNRAKKNLVTFTKLLSAVLECSDFK